ncbi:hypothetical protein SDC9_101520 [bioreactor metagenome]|uniref:Uncharacterized protein n=1 Tax=bioreactor metagenome TaxID=1076179 RepID=A0A645ANR4_9ZZZZ
MDKSTVFRRVEPRGGTRLRPQTVLHEVGEVAGLVLVHTGGRHGHSSAVNLLHGFSRKAAPLPVFHPLQFRRPLPVFRQGFKSRKHFGMFSGLLQCGAWSGQSEAAVQGPLVQYLYGRKELFHPLHQKGGVFLFPVRPGPGPGKEKTVCGLRAGGIDDRHFPVEFFFQARGGLQTEGGKQRAVVVGKEPRRRSRLRNGGVVGAQEEERLYPPVGDARGLPRRHPVQGNGNSSHRILGEHKLQEGRKLRQLHGGVA